MSDSEPASPDVQFRIDAEAIAWMRPGGTGRRYTPRRMRGWEQSVAVAAIAAMRGREPHDGPVVVQVEFVFAREASGVSAALPPGRHPHWQKPDGDNLLKAVLDAMNKVAYRDDCQVWMPVPLKQWGDVGEPAHVLVSLRFDALPVSPRLSASPGRGLPAAAERAPAASRPARPRRRASAASRSGS